MNAFCKDKLRQCHWYMYCVTPRDCIFDYEDEAEWIEKYTENDE